MFWWHQNGYHKINMQIQHKIFANKQCYCLQNLVWPDTAVFPLGCVFKGTGSSLWVQNLLSLEQRRSDLTSGTSQAITFLLFTMMEPNILYLPLWKINCAVFTSGGKKYVSLLSLPQARTITKTCPWFPIWMPSRQRYLACLFLPGISSL